MSQSTKRTLFIAVFLIIVALSTFATMAYQVVAQGHRLTEQIVTLEKQRAQESSYYRLFKLAEETTEKRARLQGFFLEKESNSIDFLNHIETLAPEAGVVLETEDLQSIKEKADETAAWIQASFSFSGERENVQNFVQILETLPYVQRVTSLEMQAQSSSLWQADITIQVRILAYEG